MKTTTLFKIIQSELIKEGFNEFVDEDGNLIFFDSEHQFTSKILSYDEDIKNIVNDLFSNVQLDDQVFDEQFKKMFLYRFINRQINRQTVESFKMQLLYTFLNHQDFLNRLGKDLDQYLTNATEQEQINQQLTDGTTTNDNRQAFASLPQTNVNINVNDTNMKSADDNTISRNKQKNNQQTDGTTKGTSKAYQLDQLLKTNGLLDTILDDFDRKCFLQFW